MDEIYKKFLLNLILENEEVKKFPKDFVTASMKWIRSWFLIDDDQVVKTVLNSSGNEALKTVILEQKLPTLMENETFKQEFERHFTEYKEQKQKIKNVIEDIDMDIKGNVRIGDNGPVVDHIEEKNKIKKGKFKIDGDFHLGDDNRKNE